METDGVFKRLEGISNLPTLPLVIQELGKAIRDPKSDAKRIGRIIEDDPAIMARVMKVVNSAFYAGGSQITSVQMAVARLGMTALNNVALSTSVFSTFGKGTDTGFNRQEFWRHSISCGIAAAVVYEKARKNLKGRIQPDALRLMGLLHDIGKIVFDQYFHDEFAEALKTSQQQPIPLLDAESKVVGMNHAQAGGWLGHKWNLGLDLQYVIKWHHNPDAAEEAAWESVALVHTANYICNIENIGISGDSNPAFLPGVWKRLGLAVSDISDVVDRVHEESKKSEILMSFV